MSLHPFVLIASGDPATQQRVPFVPQELTHVRRRRPGATAAVATSLNIVQ
ncbi:MAG: hypothetical protein ACREK1_09495 [Longimicrobiales bacterium]